MVDKAARIALMHLKYHFLTYEETRNNEPAYLGGGGADGWIDRQLIGLLAFDQISVHTLRHMNHLAPKLNPLNFIFFPSEVYKLWDQHFWMLHSEH